MRLRVDAGWHAMVLACLLCAAVASGASRFSFHVLGDDPGSWPAGVVVAQRGTDAPFEEWAGRVERGTLLVLEGESPLAAAFGFRAGDRPKVRTQSVEELLAPELRIIWAKPLDLPVFDIPSNARVFARER